MMENKNNEFPLCCDCVFQAEVEFDGKDYCIRCLKEAVIRKQKHKNQDFYMKKRNDPFSK
jgi:hypothetical protein